MSPETILDVVKGVSFVLDILLAVVAVLAIRAVRAEKRNRAL